eukprot:CAMPEP_0197181066 /NCGR_PEP_ID=MMETSP1423-20130617/5461_1 /TAXON_ID=476441 /ORGANISM="Pseudo-nitzschia heimii, Strain UNC1101" /LENGTH=286 /DNA_ID=CAMNT_0042631239 /DNA_START=65 /DNA_END=922 /DNA_ORIENTATION=-
MTKEFCNNRSSIYPLPPVGSKSVVRFSSQEFSNYDNFVCTLGSLFFAGGVFWVPAVFWYLLKRLRSIPNDQKERRLKYAALIFSITTIYVIGPHRNKKVGDWLEVRKWSLWRSFYRYSALEVVADEFSSVKDLVNQQAILGFSPHGIFPMGLGLVSFSDAASKAFGSFRIVSATATRLMPWITDILAWVNVVDASRNVVDRALSKGDRLGLAPGGIAEIFQDPDPDYENAIVGKGIFRMAVKHQVPVIPIYCFGSSMLFKRLMLPSFIEKASLMLRISFVIFFGRW